MAKITVKIPTKKLKQYQAAALMEGVSIKSANEVGETTWLDVSYRDPSSLMYWERLVHEAPSTPKPKETTKK